MLLEHLTGLKRAPKTHKLILLAAFSPKNQIKYLKTLYLRRVARTCIFAVYLLSTARIVLIRSLRPKSHVISTSYLFPVL